MPEFQFNHESPLARGLVFWMPQLGVPGSSRHVDRIKGLSFAGGAGGGYPEWVSDDKFGNVLEFDDGSSEHLTAGSAVLTGVPLTLACWFNSDAAIMGAMMGLSDTDADQYINLVARSQQSQVWGQCYDGTVGTSYGATTYTLGTWNHAAHVLYAPNSRAVFLNGGGKGTDVTNINPSGIDGTSVGCFVKNTIRVNYFSGRLWGACIWNRALSDAEVEYAYRNPYTLLRPIVPRFWSVPEEAPVGQPMWLRTTKVPYMRQWTPGKIGR